MSKTRTTLEQVLEAVEAANSLNEAATALGVESLSLAQRLKKIQKQYPRLQLKTFATERKNSTPNENVAAKILARLRGVEVEAVMVQEEKKENEEVQPPAFSESETA